MVELNGYKIDSSIIKNLHKVYDLIEYDGPILSHFVDNKNRNFFYLWVDKNNLFNRWLIWRVNDLELHRYLTEKMSLRDLLLAPTKDYIYIADIDSELNYLNFIASDIADLPNEYIPELESFFELEFDGEHPYSKYIDDKNREFYYWDLKEKSFYLKIENSDRKHGPFVGLSEINNFITSINSSYKSFLLVDFMKSFSNQISDRAKLSSIFNAAYESIDLRGVEFQQSSFEIGLTIDKTMIGSTFGESKMKSWAWVILEKYLKDVIELDYEKETEINRIINTYTEDQRSKIYSPLIKLSKDKKIKFSYRYKDIAHGKKYKVIYIKNDNAKKIVPKEVKEPNEPEYELLNAILVVKKGETKVLLTDQNTLFSSRENESIFQINSEDFAREGLEISLNEDINVEANIVDNGFTMSAYIKGNLISTTSSNFKQTKTKLIKKLYQELTNEEP